MLGLAGKNVFCLSVVFILNIITPVRDSNDAGSFASPMPILFNLGGFRGVATRECVWRHVATMVLALILECSIPVYHAAICPQLPAIESMRLMGPSLAQQVPQQWIMTNPVPPP